MSNAGAVPQPSRSAISVAIAGVCLRCETVATITAPTCPAVMPDCAIALPAACTDISATVSSGPAQRRSAIPLRLRIHSSEDSIQFSTSAFGITRTGR